MQRARSQSSPPRSRGLLSVARFLAALVDGEEAILDRQRQDSHGGRVEGAIAVAAIPGTTHPLVLQEHVVQLRTVKLPVVAAELKGRLRAVIDHVEEVALAPLRGILHEELAAADSLRGT